MSAPMPEMVRLLREENTRLARELAMAVRREDWLCRIANQRITVLESALRELEPRVYGWRQETVRKALRKRVNW